MPHGSELEEKLGATEKAARVWAGPILTAALIVAADHLTKYLARTSLQPGERVDILGDFLGFQLVFNPGAALSLGSGATRLITIFALIVCLGIIPWMLTRRLSTLSRIGISAIWGGAIGNLVDRIFFPPGALAGHVVDFIAYANWFVGNVADIAIVVGVGILLLQALRPHPDSEAASAESSAEDQ